MCQWAGNAHHALRQLCSCSYRNIHPVCACSSCSVQEQGVRLWLGKHGSDAIDSPKRNREGQGGKQLPWRQCSKTADQGSVHLLCKRLQLLRRMWHWFIQHGMHSKSIRSNGMCKIGLWRCRHFGHVLVFVWGGGGGNIRSTQ